jgi:hypothetical protein
LKKKTEPNWKQAIEDDRKFGYIAEVIQNQITGKIKRTGIISMLKAFGFFPG